MMNDNSNAHPVPTKPGWWYRDTVFGIQIVKVGLDLDNGGLLFYCLAGRASTHLVKDDDQWRGMVPMPDEIEKMRRALDTIARWSPDDFPTTGATFPSGNPVSFGAAYGSNGERDYMRRIAREALNP